MIENNEIVDWDTQQALSVIHNHNEELLKDIVGMDVEELRGYLDELMLDYSINTMNVDWEYIENLINN